MSFEKKLKNILSKTRDSRNHFKVFFQIHASENLTKKYLKNPIQSEKFKRIFDKPAIFLKIFYKKFTIWSMKPLKVSRCEIAFFLARKSLILIKSIFLVGTSLENINKS